jgi:RND superfamily putative drug exporter
MTLSLHRIGRFAARRPWIVIAAWGLAVMIVVAASAGLGREMESDFSVPGSDSGRAADLLAGTVANRGGVTARVVVAPRDAATRLAPDGADVAAVRARLAGLANVTDVAVAVSPDGQVGVLTVQYPPPEQLSVADLDALKEAIAVSADTGPLQVEGGGELFFTFETPDGGAELIGLGAAMLILLVAFGSVVAMGLPIGIAVLGLALGLAAMPLISHVVMIPAEAPQLAMMIGLGVGIDYALLLVTRHREYLSEGLAVVEAAGRAVATAGRSVVFAGITVVVAIAGLSIAGLPFITMAALATSLIVLLMVAAALTLLPALLGLVGHRIDRLSIRRHRLPGATDVSARWHRWGTHVGRHAWAYAIGTTALLVVLAAPVLWLQLGFPDEGSQPASRTERRAYDLVADGFGAGSNGPLLIAVDLAGDPVGDALAIERLTTALAADPGVAAVAPPEVDDSAQVATIVAVPTGAPQDAATYDTIERLRAEVIPAALEGTGGRAHLGGQTATWGDLAARVSGRLVPFVAAVIGLSFLLLVVVFRSLLVPLKAAVLNLLSIGAAYGVLVAVFQWGWGRQLIGLEATVPIVSFIPMFMFAVLFGLSMDYEVFLLSRVREEYESSGDNEAAVISGLAATGRVISSAALIMIAVFGAFVAGNDAMTKMFGLGLATAIAVDATIVRLVLVPATMKLLGDANWWLPTWLDRRLPRVAVDGDVPVAPAAM